MWLLCVTVAVLLAAGLYAYRRLVYSLRVPDVHKKCVFITGCDSGFGRALAVRLDGKGVPVVAGCLTEQGAQSLRDECSSRLSTVPLDVTKTESIQAAYDHVLKHLPQGCVFWGVVNNCGVFGTDGPTEFATRDDYRRLLEVNFLGMTDVNNTFLPLLKKSKGRVVNMASITGLAAMPRLAPYSASKHAVVAYSNALRMEKRIWGVNVSVVAPGGYGTQIVHDTCYMEDKKRQWAKLPRDIQEQYGEKEFFEIAEGYLNWHKHGAPMDLSPVVNCYEHALFARHPQAYYLPDGQARTMYYLHLFPSSVYDMAMAKAFVTHKLYIPKIFKDKRLS